MAKTDSWGEKSDFLETIFNIYSYTKTVVSFEFKDSLKES